MKQKFQQKPLVVEAQQWFPPSDSRHDPSMVTHRRGNAVKPPDYRQKGDIYPFTTVKGMGCDDLYYLRTGGPNDNVALYAGDWIVSAVDDPDGNKFVVRADAFERAYQPLLEDNGRIDREWIEKTWDTEYDEEGGTPKRGFVLSPMVTVGRSFHTDDYNRVYIGDRHSHTVDVIIENRLQFRQLMAILGINPRSSK